MTAMGHFPTETVTLVAWKRNLLIARGEIDRWAEALDLRIDAVDEKPRWFSTELMVTLSGPADQVQVFPKQLGGRGLSTAA